VKLDQQLRGYLVTDARAGTVERLVQICRMAIEGGMTAVQLRAKGWTDLELFRAAGQLRELTSSTGTLFIVNDRVDIALASNADGVHLGVDDLPVTVARSILGSERIIGYSPETPEDRIRAERDGADYLGIGPVFGTTTKDDAGSALGLEQFRSMASASNVPVIGIGGINTENAGSVREAGAAGVALVGAVFFADDPRSAAAKLREALT
jgi:thiamine-phosphate pyrophosphorylase